MVLSDKDFQKISEYITTTYGIQLPSNKKIMLESRLYKRMRKLGIESFKEYTAYVFSDKGKQQELTQMVDEVTTNKTEFFRENTCMEYLIETALPELVSKYGAGFKDTCRIWSSACSSGQEPYTIAMILNEWADKNPGFKFSVFASDLSTKMLKKGIRAVYQLEEASSVPIELKRKYFKMSSNINEKLARVIPELRKFVSFQKLNLMDNNFPFNKKLDIIFCRNVIIYFNQETQEKLINRLSHYLHQGGYLILGKSEVLTNMDVQLTRIAPTIYKKIS